jgi:pyridoxal phosphate-dependent aminotransferase EpsN
VGTGDLVFCQSLTFVATANPILQLGATPVFIDSQPSDWNMSAVALAAALEAAHAKGMLPKAVIVVDLFGQPADYDALVPLCARYGVPLIEDAAEALGSSYHGRPCGSFGEFGILSFNGNKIITTSGGGALAVADAETAKRAKFLITQARDAATWYEHSEAGYNYRMSNLLAAVGVAQLETLSERVGARRHIAAAYTDAFRGLPIAMMPTPNNTISNHWLSAAVLTGERADGRTADRAIHALLASGIELRHIWKPLHLQPLFKDAAFWRHDGDFAGHLFHNGFCLPSWSAMTDEAQERVMAPEEFRKMGVVKLLLGAPTRILP